MNKPYFWYYDAHERINQVFKLDYNTSNQLFGLLLAKETEVNITIKKLYQKIESKKKAKIERGAAESVRDSLNQEISILYNKVKSFRDIKNTIRNKTCRYCRYPLKEPKFKENQIGESFSHADLHSAFGYRREVILFHTECGISWLTQNIALNDKVLAKVRPQRIGQDDLLKYQLKNIIKNIK